MRADAEKKSSVSDVTQKSRNNRVRRGMMAGPIATTTQVTLLTSFPKQVHFCLVLFAQHFFFNLSKDSQKRRLGRRTEVPEPLFWKDDEGGQSMTGLSVAGLNQRSLERSLRQNSVADGVGEGHELWTVSERLQREPCFEKTGQDTLKTKK